MEAKKSQATLILGLGIAGILPCLCMCFPIGGVAFYLGRNEIAAIDKGELPEEGRQFATIGMWLGLAGAILGIITLVMNFFFGFLGMLTSR